LTKVFDKHYEVNSNFIRASQPEERGKMEGKIQCVGLREGRGTVFLQHGWRLDNVEQVFNQAHRAAIIEKIPENERFNIY